MTKRELIDRIVAINRSASPSFLARFGDQQLDEYLAHLRVLETPRLTGDARRYERYFRNLPTIHAPRPAWRTAPAGVEDVVADELDLDLDADDEMPALANEAFDEQPVGPAEREALYAEPDEIPDEADTWDLDDAPANDRQEPEAPPTDEPQPQHELPVPAAAGATQTALPFADSQEDTESWLY